LALLTADPATPRFAESGGGQVVRVIDDPSTGSRWLLAKDAAFPGGPGRMLLAFAGESRIGTAAATRSTRPPLAIRTGDRLLVEESSAVAEVRLEAVAMGSAPAGALLDVRLKIGGRVLRVRALGAGRAEFLAPSEVER
jgi:hypothetical protein